MDGQVRLVIVDDHDLMRKTWKMVLQRDSRIAVVAECASGKEAVACATEKELDVMLMDINMTPVNGFEATRQIVELKPSIKIIGLSMNNRPAYARNLMQLGAKGYVTKNSPPEEMIRAIMAVCKGDTYICKEVREQMPANDA